MVLGNFRHKISVNVMIINIAHTCLHVALMHVTHTNQYVAHEPTHPTRGHPHASTSPACTSPSPTNKLNVTSARIFVTHTYVRHQHVGTLPEYNYISREVFAWWHRICFILVVRRSFLRRETVYFLSFMF